MSQETRNPYLYGRVVSRNPYSVLGGSDYIIEGEDGLNYKAHYSDILTEGMRTFRISEKVRFIPGKADGQLQALYILRIDIIGEELFYQDA